MGKSPSEAIIYKLHRQNKFGEQIKNKICLITNGSYTESETASGLQLKQNILLQ